MADSFQQVVNMPAYYGLLQMNRNLFLCNSDQERQLKPYSFENVNLYPYGDLANRQPSIFQESNAVASNQDPATVVASPNVKLSSRAKRTFVPNEQKDLFYWMKRLKNNVSARRSRVKRKVLEQYMERKLAELQAENNDLKREIDFIRAQCDCQKKNATDIQQSIPKTEFFSSSSSRSESSASSCPDISESESSSKDREFFTERETLSSSDETDPELSCPINFSPDEPAERQKVPHKIRLKLRLHSAFSKHQVLN